ncbi:MAG TPA: pyruvate dehydrogenase complex E1 component subunit beta [Anaerolineae bacterium]|nr:pyruvate dehydrogenase complex E1 component subunit beta [Anaerolineae bacterium]HQH37341.1 pyruvate dehydrogenase complex E1 component subunit beta [Anaerolineae bacterium]
MTRELTYGLAINEATRQMMEADPAVFLLGQGVNSPWYVGNTTTGLKDHFGPERVFDTPVSENAITGAAIGAALAGMRPVVIHPRMDFALLAVEQIVNQAANWRYMFGGHTGVPVVMRAIINRGGEQAAQHSQAFQALYAHIPGLKVVMPSTAYDAKGLLVAAIRDNDPVIYIDDRWLYTYSDDVPEELYEVPIGKAALRRCGDDATVVATSYMAQEALKAAAELATGGIEIEVIDVRTLKPLDDALIFQSVAKTGRLVVADAAWLTCGFAAEVAARVASEVFESLKAPILRVALPDTPAPMSASLEKVYYPTAKNIVAAVQNLLNR